MLSKIMTVIQRGGGQALRKPKIGAIFVEFAIAIPVLIAIVYYLHDVPKYKRMQAGVNLCAHCVVNMLQNVSSNKALTMADIERIRCTAALTIYPGMTSYAISGSGNSAFRHVGHFLSLYIYCVSGTGKNKGMCVWRWDSSYQNTSPANSTTDIQYNDNSYSIIRYKSSETSTSNIYKELTIEKDEIKIIVEVSLRTGLCKYASGKSVSSVPISERFGFFVLTPSCPTPQKSGSHFHSVVIFTPKPGLFGKTAPKKS